MTIDFLNTQTEEGRKFRLRGSTSDIKNPKVQDPHDLQVQETKKGWDKREATTQNSNSSLISINTDGSELERTT